MQGFLRRNSYCGGKTPTQLLQRLHSAPTTPAHLPAATLTTMIHAQVQLLRAIQATISGLEKLIKELVALHPRARFWQPCPASVRSTSRNCSPTWTDAAACRHRRAGRRRVRHHPGDQSLRQSPRRLLPLGRQHPSPHRDHRLRAQRPPAITRLAARAREMVGQGIALEAVVGSSFLRTSSRKPFSTTRTTCAHGKWKLPDPIALGPSRRGKDRSWCPATRCSPG
jgi:hypothetical protein